MLEPLPSVQLALEVEQRRKASPAPEASSTPAGAPAELMIAHTPSLPHPSCPAAPIVFGTKAETLERLKPLVQTCAVPEVMFFTAADWQRNSAAVCNSIRARFGDAPLAVRSSACHEDGAVSSHAGAYRSVLGVDGTSPDAVRQAVEAVLASYPSRNPRDQVLVQPMIQGIAMSGVIMTHDLTSGAPYTIINYDDESGRTDVITGGAGVNKTVVVHHDAHTGHIESPRVAQLLGMVSELQRLCGKRVPLDIEFAQTRDGRLHLLQVRRIAVQKNWNRAVRTRLSEALEHIEQFLTQHAAPRPGLAGDTTLLGQMPDWNPAELIGTQPGPMAVSLFRTLVTDRVWQEARRRMGYRPMPNEPLMVLLAGRPYIDVRNSFNSFLPAGLPAPVEHALVNAWLSRLARHPEFHDKVEFEVAETVFEFDAEARHRARYENALNPADRALFFDRLRALTARNVTLSPEGTLEQAWGEVAALEELQAGVETILPMPPLRRALRLIEECRRLGTLPFSVIARHAFMAEALLRSAVRRNAWTPDRLDAFKRSLTTVAGRLGRDFGAVLRGALSPEDFFARYGHLRPGTFDILSPRYDQRDGLFRDTRMEDDAGAQAATPFALTASERAAFARLLAEAGLALAPEELLQYAGRAIVGREHAKFVFTRHLSDAIECIAEWGEHTGLTREDLSWLTLHDLEETLTTPQVRDQETHFHELAESRHNAARQMRGLRLGYILRDAHDLYVVPLHRSAANFVTTRDIEAPAVLLDNRMTGETEIFGRIVCIESADPGFDWIFAKGIAGIVTKFGGANSHMTIRCAELGIPAAIGVGESTFDRLAQAGRIELRCSQRIVRTVYG